MRSRETLGQRRGPKIKARGIYRDAGPSSRQQLVKASSLLRISLMWLGHGPWGGRDWALPLLTVLRPRRGTTGSRDAGIKLTGWARQMILQLLPSMERPSYASVQVEVLEHTDGRLQVPHEGEIIPCRPAPPRPGALRASHGALAPNPESVAS